MAISTAQDIEVLGGVFILLKMFLIFRLIPVFLELVFYHQYSVNQNVFPASWRGL